MGPPPQSNPRRVVAFTLDEPRYALDLAAVERVVRAVEITPLPQAPEIVRGVVNVHGLIVPVVDLRRRFGLPVRELSPEDRFIVAQTPRRRVALAVDAVAGVRELEGPEVVSVQEGLAFAAHLRGVAKLADGLLLICDLDRFLALDEERALDAALAEAGDEAHAS